MYQVTAMYKGAEIAYAESYTLDFAKQEVKDQIAEGFYAPLLKTTLIKYSIISEE